MTTIDELAPNRNWFRGNPEFPFTALVDAYMADSLDLPTTVTKIVQPVNEKYSSSDAGGEPTTETLLWDLWYTILYSAKKTSRTAPTPTPDTNDDKARAANLDPSLPSPGHLKLLSLLETLKTNVPEPAAPSQAPDDWIFREDGKVWSVLLLFGPATREILNEAPGTGSGYEDVELQAWGNLNAFLAHVARRQLVELDKMGVFALRHALEQPHKDDVKGKFQANEARKLEAFVAAAGIWAVIMGEALWERKGEKGGQRKGSQDGIQAKGDVINKQRWKLWIERLQFMSCREDLNIGTRELAAQAAAIMGRVHA